MPPSLALLLWAALLLLLLFFDPAREAKNSLALWVPLIWLFFLGSRSPSMWLGFSYGSQGLEEGNPVDRAVFSLLTVAAFAILASRPLQWGKLVTQNSALACFLAFALLSVAWSDFPLATFKKWFRDTGIYMAVLVVLSDRRPLEAVRTVLRRVCYLLIPLSIVLIKYYPQLGKSFSAWGGEEYTGAATTKNMLGALCLVSGMFFFWDTITLWWQRSAPRVRRVIFVNGAFIGMTLWLLNASDSKTSIVCLGIGCLMIATVHSTFGQRHLGLVKALAPVSFLLYLTLTVAFGMGSQLSQAVGRSGDLSDRTHIWQVLLSVPINRFLGTGYQSFWLGSRTQWVWARLNGDSVGEAHNGYLAIYLDLGLIGLCLLCVFLIATYRKISKRLKAVTPLASLSLGLWTLLLFYNVTEASFEVDLLLATFLLANIAVPERGKNHLAAVRPATGDCAEHPASVETTGYTWSRSRRELTEWREKGFAAARGDL